MKVSFNRFRGMVDKAVCAKVGVGIDDLEDTLILEDYWEEDEDMDLDDWKELADDAADDILAYSGYKSMED